MIPAPGSPPTVGFLRVQYLLLLAASGAFGPYVALHLRRLGWSGEAIAGIFAVTSAIWIVSGPVWASIADGLGRGGRMFAVLGTLAAGCMALVAGAPGTAVVAVALAGNALFRGPLSVLLDGQVVATLEARGLDVRGYGSVRLWGSLGFLGSALVAGQLAERSTTTALALAAGLLVIASSLGVRLDGVRREAPRARLAPAVAAMFRDRVLRALLATAVLHGAAMSAYDGYFALLLSERALPAGLAGAGLAVGVLAEVAVMQSGTWLLGRFDASRVLAVGGWVMAARLLLTALVTDPVALVALQLLHGVAFGGWWVAMVEVARQRAPEGVRASVQAVAGSAAYGIGPLLCQAVAGAVLDRGGVATLYALTSLFAVAGGVVALSVRPATDDRAADQSAVA